MRKPLFTIALILFVGFFALILPSFFYLQKTAENTGSVDCLQTTESFQNGELLWESLSRQLLTAMVTK